MRGMRPGRIGAWMVVLVVFGVISADRRAAGAVIRPYDAFATMDSAANDYDLSLWSSNIRDQPPSYWYQGDVVVGWFLRYGGHPSYPSGKILDATYTNVPFTIRIMPSVGVPSSPPGYQYSYSVTGPQYDGALLHGVLNGTFHADGQADVTATFTSVTPFDIANHFRQDLQVPYTIDPSLPNPFPIDRIVLPDPVHVNANGFTDLTIRMLPDPVPEPTSLLVFAPLFAGLASRSKACRRYLAGALAAAR